jgi:hypothetical protein
MSNAGYDYYLAKHMVEAEVEHYYWPNTGALVFFLVMCLMKLNSSYFSTISSGHQICYLLLEFAIGVRNLSEKNYSFSIFIRL